MSFRSSLVAILAGTLLACGQGSSGHAPAAPAAPSGPSAQSVTVGVEPGATDVQLGGTARFVATVTGTADTSVAWDVVEAGGGSVTATGLYSAPQSTGVFHVRATSRAAPDVSAQAAVTVVAAPVVTIAISPRTAALLAGGTRTFTATVTNAANTAVDWSADCGTVTAAGVYTAPQTAGTCTVVARSQADATKIDAATVTVTLPVSVAVSPKTPSVVAGGTQAFTATVSNATNAAVTWSVPTAGCGSITAAGVYTAPATARTCTVVATSQADATKSDTATVTVTAAPPPVAVSVTPSPATADACRTVTFTATVTNATDRTVTWTVQEGAAGGTITAAGVYTAPSVAGTYHVVATSNADGTKTAVVPVTVGDRVLSVAVSPQTIQVPTGGTAQFTATVTTTCGTTTVTSTITSAGEIVAR